MRLIDIDVLGVGRCNPDVFKVPDRAEGWNDLLDIINSAPAIDAVEVVRCKDCIYASFYPNKLMYECGRYEDVLMFPDDYCSYGKRRGE